MDLDTEKIPNIRKYAIFKKILDFYGSEYKKEITFKQLTSSVIEVYFRNKTIVHSCFEPIIIIDNYGCFAVTDIKKPQMKRDLVKYSVINNLVDIQPLVQEQFYNQIFKL